MPTHQNRTSKRAASKRPARPAARALVAGPAIGTGSLDILRAIPEERVWLEGQQSFQTRRAYRSDVLHFMRTMGITNTADFRKVDRMAVIAWKRAMEREGAKPRTVRRRLSALSSLFLHLVEKRVADFNPVREIRRPKVNYRQGTTAAFSPAQARKILDAPDPTTVQGLRDRAILSVGFQVGPRRSEIASLKVKDFHENAGYPSLHFIRKGGEDHSLAIHQQAAERIRAYLAAAGHAPDHDGPLFRPIRASWKVENLRRHLDPDLIDRIVRKYARQIGLLRGFSAHSMRATFITRALDNGASLEEVQRAAGHADASTTKLYDRRGYNPEKSASFFASY
ncbi:MAG: tyrosine-type recombinase/integrase [Candidatus Binatia bacterium]